MVGKAQTVSTMVAGKSESEVLPNQRIELRSSQLHWKWAQADIPCFVRWSRPQGLNFFPCLSIWLTSARLPRDFMANPCGRVTFLKYCSGS